MNVDREIRVHDVIERAVSHVYAAVWLDSTLTAAESRLAWLGVIVKLVQSVQIDAATEFVKEQMAASVKPDTS